MDRVGAVEQANSKLPGHPELGLTPGVRFSSGRLGHMWPLVNGVALADKSRVVFMLGSDGSQQEGDNAEAARLAVAQGLNVKLFIDDNDVTIACVTKNASISIYADVGFSDRTVDILPTTSKATTLAQH